MCIFTHSTLTRVLPVSFVLLVSGAPAIAASTVTFPVSVPQECMELAQREGVPTVISSAVFRPTANTRPKIVPAMLANIMPANV